MIDHPPKKCGVCGIPLNPKEDVFTGHVTYVHPERAEGEYDHAAVAVHRDPTELVGVCDFCSHPVPVARFATRKAIVMIDPDGYTRIFSEPWLACSRCAVMVRNRTPHLLLDRAAFVLPGEVTNRERSARRSALKQVHMKFFAAEPYEI
ncbi:hypothetical protein ACN20G_23350 [Streptomyces sp. BI20]|uniref:hypothetical protein n=1 Tax=Streptomyces sp. BI20 TaxID=3403460 RepID=UPI003C7456F6